MKRKSIDNADSQTKQTKQTKSESNVSVSSDTGDEVDYLRVPIKNTGRATPIVKSSGVVAYKVKDIRV